MCSQIDVFKNVKPYCVQVDVFRPENFRKNVLKSDEGNEAETLYT